MKREVKIAIWNRELNTFLVNKDYKDKAFDNGPSYQMAYNIKTMLKQNAKVVDISRG